MDICSPCHHLVLYQRRVRHVLAEHIPLIVGDVLEKLNTFAVLDNLLELNLGVQGGEWISCGIGTTGGRWGEVMIPPHMSLVHMRVGLRRVAGFSSLSLMLHTDACIRDHSPSALAQRPAWGSPLSSPRGAREGSVGSAAMPLTQKSLMELARLPGTLQPRSAYRSSSSYRTVQGRFS